MFKGFRVLSTVRFLSKPGTVLLPHRRKAKNFLQKITKATKGFPLAMFKGFKVLSMVRFLSKSGTAPRPHRRKAKSLFTEDNEGCGVSSAER
jgi:hypothetical protein